MAEIKISELSIGDWVMNGEAYQVQWIERENVGLIKHTGTEEEGSIHLTAVPLSFIEPIPLTPEILEKNGFVKSSECRWSNPSIGCACLRLGTKYWDIRIRGRNRAYRPTRISIDNIVHTHQLQHALRLAGVGKEIEL